MQNLADRLSGLFFLLLGLAMYFVIIPIFVEDAQGGNIAPDTMPNYVSIIMALAGAILIVKPSDLRLQEPVIFIRAGMLVAILITAIIAMSYLGYIYIAPILALLVMLIIGEKRPTWLLGGCVIAPAAIWFLVTQLLDRSLP